MTTNERDWPWPYRASEEDLQIVKKLCVGAVCIKPVEDFEISMLRAAMDTYDVADKINKWVVDRIIATHAPNLHSDGSDLWVKGRYVTKRNTTQTSPSVLLGITLQSEDEDEMTPDEYIELEGTEEFLSLAIACFDNIKETICETHRKLYSPALNIPKAEFPQADWDTLGPSLPGGKIVYGPEAKKAYPLQNLKAEIVMGKFVVFSPYGAF